MNSLQGEKGQSPGVSRGLVQGRLMYTDFLNYIIKGIDRKDILMATKFIPPGSREDFNY